MTRHSSTRITWWSYCRLVGVLTKVACLSISRGSVLCHKALGTRIQPQRSRSSEKPHKSTMLKRNCSKTIMTIATMMTWFQALAQLNRKSSTQTKGSDLFLNEVSVRAVRMATKKTARLVVCHSNKESLMATSKSELQLIYKNYSS